MTKESLIWLKEELLKLLSPFYRAESKERPTEFQQGADYAVSACLHMLDGMEDAGICIGKRIERTVRKETEEYLEYLRARFQAPRKDTFEWEGHRWKYHVSHFDDVGEFDIIFRHETKPMRGNAP